VAALAVAAVVRVAWLADKPLWRDEAWVAVLAREAGDHFELSPRPVPAGFLFLSAAALRLPVLPPEITLRLLPLAAGLATVALLPLLVRDLDGRPGVGAAAAWLAAGMPVLIYYSRELKPYALDALLAVAVPWLFWRGFGEGQPERPAREGVALAALLAAAPWTTFGSVFPIGAAFLWAASRAWRAPHARRAFAGLSLVYALSFVAAYTVVVREQSMLPRLVLSWHSDMARLHERPWPFPLLQVSCLYAQVALVNTFGRLWPAAIALAALGAWTWPRPGRALLMWQVAGGGALAATAALMGRYVVSQGRFLVFAAPALIVLVAGGLAALTAIASRRLPRATPAWTAAAAAVVALAWSVQALAWRVRPYHNDQTRYFRFDILHDVDPLIGETARRAAAADPVITSRYTGEQFRFYARGRLPQTFVCTRANCLDEGPAIRTWLEGVKDRGWMILLEEEDRPWRRQAVRQAGFAVQEAATARGARLWEIRRRPVGAGAAR
jgi:hypothetical protein